MGLKISEISIDSSTEKKPNTPSSKGSLKELMNKDIQLFGSNWGLKQKEAFYSELFVLLSSGLDIKKTLSVIASNRKKKRDQILIQEIENTIINGASLSQAIQQSNKFSDYEIFSLKIGEESGKLNPILKELSLFYAKGLKYKQQLVSALTYPIFVIGFAVLVVFFLLKYLVPLFSDIYKKFDGKLPKITQTIINLSDWLAVNGFSLFLILVGLIFILYLQRHKIWFRKSFAFIILRFPVFGPIIKKIYLARFAQSMYLLLNARVPLLRSVELVQRMVGFYSIESSLKKAKQDILKGKSLYQAIAGNPLYPQQFSALIEIGEETGKLDDMFQKLSKQYSEEVEQQTTVISSLIEPILIISLGIVVGIILVAMYMPLFQMSAGIG